MLFLLKNLALLVGVTAGVHASVNTLQQQTGNWGANPTNVGFYYYKPPYLIPNPALVVAIHYCTGTAQAFYSGTEYANLADKFGSFVVIYPDAPDPGGCWDVHTNATLTHDAGGDSLAIANMVRFAISSWGVDARRVYMTGISSGGMMTNVLAGAYPDLFVAGSAWAGVPYGCFGGPDLWNTPCATGQITQTAQQWGDEVRSGYPGYTGPRPKLQIWQGTLDTTLNYHNFGEGIKQWTNVFGYSATPTEVDTNWPLSNWTRSIYGPNFQAISAAGVDHNIPIQANQVLEWFGITPSGTSPPSTTTVGQPVQEHWGQCGGIGWTGPVICVSGTTCTVMNPWFSQCI